MRILIVEDEKKLCELIARALKAERFAVDEATDGNQGWLLADSYEYDLIILDLMLPGMGGAEILRRIRRKNQQVPILILTAHAMRRKRRSRISKRAPTTTSPSLLHSRSWSSG